MAQEPTAIRKLNKIGIDAICERIAECETLQAISDGAKVSKGSLLNWLNSSDEHIDQYARAKEAQADKLADDILRIADDEVCSVILVGGVPLVVDGKLVQSLSNEAVQHARLRIDARKWLAGKMNPKKYSDKVQTEHTGAGGGPIAVMLGEIAANPNSRIKV